MLIIGFTKFINFILAHQSRQPSKLKSFSDNIIKKHSFLLLARLYYAIILGIKKFFVKGVFVFSII